jgi:hypothetical protein
VRVVGSNPIARSNEIRDLASVSILSLKLFNRYRPDRNGRN